MKMHLINFAQSFLDFDVIDELIASQHYLKNHHDLYFLVFQQQCFAHLNLNQMLFLLHFEWPALIQLQLTAYVSSLFIYSTK